MKYINIKLNYYYFFFFIFMLKYLPNGSFSSLEDKIELAVFKQTLEMA